MSWYYTYYLGVKSAKDGKVYPLGPFDYKARLMPVLCNSRSFEPEGLNDDFARLNKEDMSQELKDALHQSDEDDGEFTVPPEYLPLDELPTGSPVKNGWYLMEDVKYYKDGGSTFDDIFYDHLDDEQYLAKMENELKFGIPKPKYDEEGNEFDFHPCSDYMKFAYMDDSSKEYAAYMLRQAAGCFSIWKINKDFGEDAKIVVVLTQG